MNIPNFIRCRTEQEVRLIHAVLKNAGYRESRNYSDDFYCLQFEYSIENNDFFYIEVIPHDMSTVAKFQYHRVMNKYYGTYVLKEWNGITDELLTMIALGYEPFEEYI